MSGAETWTDWTPFFLSKRDGQAWVEWGYLGRERFTDPFFHDTLQRLLARPFNRVFRRRTPPPALLERAAARPGLPLGGIVFHMSRCGSTLVSQSLAALSDAVALSEPEPVGTLLEWQIAAPESDPAAESALLRGLLSALGQPRRPEDRRLFLKAECWQVCHSDRLLAAFPGVPWIFVYRDPLEVLASQARMPSLYLVPGAGVRHGLTAPPELLTRPMEHAAWMLANILRAAATTLDRHPGGRLVNYRELPEALETRVADHFGLALRAGDTAALREARDRDAKQPQQAFQSDSAHKRATAHPGLQEIAARWLDGPYAELERRRGRQP